MTGGAKNNSSFPREGQALLLFPEVSRRALGPSLIIQRALRDFFTRVKRLEREADYSLLEPRLRMGGAIPPLPHTLSWRARGQFHLCNVGFELVCGEEQARSSSSAVF